MAEPSKPWDKAAMASASHAELYNERSKATSQEAQDAIAPYEHRAFAREAVTENPAMALPLAAAIPAYQASKALGLEDSRSNASMDQVIEGYKGIGEGLANSVKAPWEKAQEMFENVTNSVKETAGEAVQAVKSMLPWERAQTVAKTPVAPPVAPKQISRFDTIFTKLVQTESGGKHTDASGNLTTSPVGAQGITQVMPKVGKDPGYGVTPLQNTTEAEYRRFGRDYLQAMLKEFDGDYEKGLAAYNWGVGNVKKAIKRKGDEWKQQLPPETQKYLKKILGKNNA